MDIFQTKHLAIHFKVVQIMIVSSVIIILRENIFNCEVFYLFTSWACVCAATLPKPWVTIFWDQGKCYTLGYEVEAAGGLVHHGNLVCKVIRTWGKIWVGNKFSWICLCGVI